MAHILVVSPHPDDESLGMGGTIRKHVLNGDRVLIIYLTSGERGIPGVDTVTAAEIREKEAIEASKVLGTFVDFWHEPDGLLKATNELRDRLLARINDLSPELIYVTHERESHPDHAAAGKLVRQALGLMSYPPPTLTYEVWTPHTRVDRVVDISESRYIDAKLEAMEEHKSQMQRQDFGEAAISLARYRGIMNGHCKYAEAFGRLRLSGAEGMRIAIALLTYSPSVSHPRTEYALTTLTNLLSLIDPGQGNTLHLHIADDGSDPLHVSGLVEMAREYGYEPSISNAERGGYGRSYNLACQALHDSFDLIFPIEDDWQLMKPLNLGPLAAAIDNSGGEIRCIRLGYLGHTQELRGKLIYHADQSFLLLDPSSPEPHVFAGGPRLETVAYERDIEPWPEKMAAGYVEWEVTHRWPARNGVVWPMDLCIPASQVSGCLFGHIGSISVAQEAPV